MNTIRIKGISISVKGNIVVVDGKRIDLSKETDKEITIIVEGNVEKLEIDYCHSLEIKGNTGSVKTTSGDVRCGAISGGVQTTSGDVHATSIGGDVSTVSGDVN